MTEVEYLHLSKSTYTLIETIGNYVFWIVITFFGFWVLSKFFANIRTLREEG